MKHKIIVNPITVVANRGIRGIQIPSVRMAQPAFNQEDIFFCCWIEKNLWQHVLLQRPWSSVDS